MEQLTLQQAMDNTANKLAETINTSGLPYPVLKIMLTNILFQLDLQSAQAELSKNQTGEKENAESES